MRSTLASLTVSCLALTAPALAQPSGEEVMRHTDQDHRASDERGVVELVLVAENGERQRRELELLLKTGEGEDDMSLIRFLAPETVRGTAVLTLEASDRADDQWLYLPDLRKKKRVASSNRTQRFAGTDFTFEDLRSENFAQYEYEVVGEEAAGEEDKPCYIVEATPREGANSGYAKRRIWVEQERYLVWKIEYYDRPDRLQKTFESRGFRQVEGKWRALRSMMHDHLRGTRTVWQFTSREIDPGLPDSTFTVGNLERGL